VKKIIAATALIGSAVSAQAADLPTKAPYYKAPIAQIYNWTGFYAGVNAGVGFNRSFTTLTNTGFGDANRLGGLGALGGGQIGYNWQYGNFLGFGNIVLGLEADIQGTGINDDRTCLGAGSCGAGGYGLNQKIDWFGTARGRVGLATGSVLTYFTGGFAYGNVKTTFNNTGNSADSLSLSNTRTGWTIGSGVEAALGGNWTGKIEYLYVDLGNQNGVTPVNGFVVGSDVRASVFRVGLNYRIGGTGIYAPEPIANWSGFYIGGNGGGATALNRSSLDIAGLGSPTSKFNLSPDGYFGGAQIGYNWQAANWVYGLEADIQGASLKDDRVCLLSCTTGQFVSYDQKMQWFGTVRGRVGYSLGSTLFYGTGGLAYGGVKTRVQEFVGFAGGLDQTFDKTKTGYTVGGGIESPFEFMGMFGKNWTAKTEYLYIDLGRSTETYTLGGIDHTLTTRVQEHMLRTGLNYHFNSPVVAKY
jgi:outer membrane immunogenic protein